MYTKESLMPYGKYRKFPLVEVPVEYLLRLYLSGNLPDKDLMTYIESLLGSLGMTRETRKILVACSGSRPIKVKCEKTPFRSERAAGEALHAIQKKSYANKIPRRCYYCKDCGFWHLTSLLYWASGKSVHRKAPK